MRRAGLHLLRKQIWCLRLLVRNKAALSDSYSDKAAGYHLLFDHELRWSRHYVFGGE